MNKRIYLGGIAIFLVVIAVGYFAYSDKTAPTVIPAPKTADAAPPSVPSVTPPATETSTTTPKNAATLITVNAPTPGAVAKSPLTISGSARGSWYFEASFPVELVDANGVQLAIAPAKAQGDWMTENFVPFTVTLSWSSTSTTATSGVIILHKDNPSGLPEHDASISIPVRF